MQFTRAFTEQINPLGLILWFEVPDGILFLFIRGKTNIYVIDKISATSNCQIKRAWSQINLLYWIYVIWLVWL